jgi:hypothetical protein
MRKPIVSRVGFAGVPGVELLDPPQPTLRSATSPSAHRDVAFAVIANSFPPDPLILGVND